MLLSIQFEEASDLLWDLFHELSEKQRLVFAPRVDKITSALWHPADSSTTTVVFVGCDGARKRPKQKQKA